MGKYFTILFAVLVTVTNIASVSLENLRTPTTDSLNTNNGTSALESSGTTHSNTSDTSASQSIAHSTVPALTETPNSVSKENTHSSVSSQPTVSKTSQEKTDNSVTSKATENKGEDAKSNAVTQSNDIAWSSSNHDGVLIVSNDEGWLSKFGLKDQKLVISILIPVAGGVFGALAIVTVVYCIRKSRFRRRRVQRRRLIGAQDLSSADHVMLLGDSSEDEF